jgi:S1-C subfamily serine protease
MSKIWTTLGTVLVLTASISGFVAAQEEGEENTRPWLGVSVRDAENGAVVEQVSSDSPAEAAEIEAGDVIVSFNEAEITAAQALVEAVQAAAVGDTVTLGLLRGEEELTVEVTLAEFPERGRRDPGDRPNLGGFDRGETAFIILGVIAAPVDEGFEVLDTLPTAGETLNIGDIIIAINGDSVKDLDGQELFGMMFSLDEPAEITILRDGEEMTVTVELVEPNSSGLRPEDRFTPMPDGGFMMQGRGAYLGVQYAMLTEEFATNLGLATTQGALIEAVEPDSPAARAGLQAGDIITAIDGELVDEDDPLDEVISDYEADEVATLTLIRAGEEQSIEVTFGANFSGFGQDGMPYEFFDYFNGGRDFNMIPNMPQYGRPDRLPAPRQPFMPDGLNMQMECRDQDGNIVIFLDLGGDSHELDFIFPELSTLENTEGLECDIVTGEIPQDEDADEGEEAPAEAEGQGA